MSTLSLFAAQEAAEDELKAKAAAAEREANRDKVAEKLIELGYGTEYSLGKYSCNSHLGDWGICKNEGYPWNLPSRLFQWPIEFCHYEIREDGWGDDVTQTQLGLCHPLLVDHPLYKKLIAEGFEVHTDHVLYETMWSGEWYHACDLCTETWWRKLLDTKQFTTERDIAHAVAFKCRYFADRPEKKKERDCLDGITIKTARLIMAEINAPEPEPIAALKQFSRPSPCKAENGKGPDRWPINGRFAPADERDPKAEAWATIHAMEQGWFEKKGEFLHWSAKGREAFDEVNGERDAIETDDTASEADSE